MMHQKKIAKLKHKVFCKNKPRIINNKSDNISNYKRKHKYSIPKAITKLSDKICDSSKFGGGKKTLALHHNLAYVSYSIPLLSSLALLMVLGLSFAPDMADSIIKGITSVDKASATTEVVGQDDVKVDYGIAPYASSSALTITPAATGGHGAYADETTMATPGSVAYRAHDVHVHLEDATSYALQVTYSYGRTNLSLEGGNTVYSDVPESGVVGSSMAPGTWGFAWGETNATDSAMTYYKMPQFNKAGTVLKDGGLAINSTVSGATDFTKKLVFGASFTENALSGHYTTSVLLSLSASAKDVMSLSDLESIGGAMQDILPEICANSAFDSKVYNLIDRRDGNKKYGVTRLSNGDCWMTQNLSLDLNGRTLKPADSNIKTDWTSTTGASAAWATTGSTDDAYNMVKYFNGSGGTGYTSNYGYYYSFGAATAGTSKNFTSGNQTVNQDICPKGWRLPTRADFVALIKNSSPYNGSWNTTSKAFVMNTTMGNLSFPAAGRVNASSLDGAGSAGYYWSSTTYASSAAYNFIFSSSSTYPEDTSNRFLGYSVRCMAKRTGDA